LFVVDGGPNSTAVSVIDAAFNGFHYRSGERTGGKNMGKPILVTGAARLPYWV
jgi:hypothetical protein